MAFSTQVRLAVNRLLRPVRLQLTTTLLEEQELARRKGMRTAGHWDIARFDQSIALDHRKFLDFLAAICAGCKDGYTAFPREATQASNGGFYLRNNWFECVDAEVLYAMVRYFHPSRIVEVGSGFSTRVVRRAIADGKLTTKITCIDPQPRALVEGYADQHIASAVEALSPATIVDQLGENDILFIDSSHQVVQGTDIPFLFLEVLPRLRRNVLIHIHDIFLPFDYPEGAMRRHWNEQYLVHAFLAYNPAFEILWPASYMWTKWQSEVQKQIPVASLGNPPSSLWLRKIQ
jgi:predicted O-methyltransferase YrrM